MARARQQGKAPGAYIVDQNLEVNMRTKGTRTGEVETGPNQW
jgi:hypothetical protein